MKNILIDWYYLQHLNNLLENYLEPLKKETFLSNAEINALFGNIQEIVTFQRQFLNNLEEAIDVEPDFYRLDYCSQFKVTELTKLMELIEISVIIIFLQNVLFAIGSSFLSYVNHFKLYSSFCASHSKAQKVLHPSKYSLSNQRYL